MATVQTVTAAPARDPGIYLLQRVGFAPTPEQARILACAKRFILVAGGEQAGKSMIASKYLLMRMLETDGPGLFWLVAADYNRTQREFEYLREDLLALGLADPKQITKRVDPGHIVLFDGTRIETKSAKDPRTLAMHAPNGVLGCEASQLDLETYWRLRSRLAPKRGWLFLGGTFESSLGWYPSLFQAWQHGTGDEQSFSLPSWTNTYLYPQGRQDPEILRLEREAGEEYFLERLAGVPCPPKGLVFPQFRPDVHIREVQWTESEPVYLWIDPGYAGAYAVEVVQEINGQVVVFDEIYEQGLITEQIIGIAMGRRWWKDVRGGAIDVAATQHQAMAAPTEVWMQKGGLYLASQKVPINQGTERLKSFLTPDPLNHTPRIVFSPKCRGILSEFGAYPNPFDGQTKCYRWKLDREGNVVGGEPEDKYNHGTKAIIYGLVDRYGYARDRQRQLVKVRRW